jgi:uncharacterized protein YqgC (DUF456 family)
MDILLFTLGLLCSIIGIIGSIIPGIPGPPISWIGLLLIYLIPEIPFDYTFLSITFAIAIAVFFIDLFVPAMGTKKMGGTRYGIVGSILGVFIAIIFPILGFIGLLFWPFLGAFIGELINKKGQNDALKAALGSFLGFVAGTFLKLILTFIYIGYFISITWEYKSVIFNF